MAATIRDVARKANVSVATVSRYVNGTYKVRGVTAERVKAAIEELSFRPNAVGRSLSTSSTKSIGMIIPSISNPVFADAVSGVSDVMRTEGYSLTLASSNYDVTDELSAISTLLENRVDGIILTVANPAQSKALSMLEKSQLPYCMIYNQPTAGHSTVTVDNVAAGYDVARAMIRLGHQRLGMISGKFASSDRAYARRTGFLKGVDEAGLEPPAIVEVGYEDEQVSKALENLYADLNTAPTALFCSNDLLAISVIGSLRRRKIAVPDQVSVIGFDGISVGSHMYPALATVVQPSKEMGRTAARHLLEMLLNGQEQYVSILSHILRLGESAGPACKLDPAVSQPLSQNTSSKRSTT
jgi:DNA-binding LacI/PurR family transcriptional regulator